jgi:hypothetical protein
MSYTILYIDEEKTALHSFERALGTDFEIKSVDFTDLTLEKLILILDERDFDYLVIDFNLNEKSGCGFNGDDVLADFTKKFPHFPVMLLTNFDDQAVVSIQGFDTEKIHNKKEYGDEALKDAFIKRIKRIIDDYKKQNTNAEARIAALIQKKASGEVLNAAEEEEAIKLDTFLDEVLDGEAKKIPDQIKESNEEKIGLLLDKTDTLITKLEEYENIPE